MINVYINDHHVLLSGGFSDPQIDFSLSAKQAYDLLCSLKSKESVLHDLATNYYSCPDCGGNHHKDVKKCPNISEDGE
jgi:hypothetical protein